LSKGADRRFFLLAAALAVALHLLLFLAVRPASGDGLSGRPVPPKTHYLAGTMPDQQGRKADARILWSPVLFSLPSTMGFSRGLLEEKLSTRLTFRQPNDTERFLEVDTALRGYGPQIDPDELLLTASGWRYPGPPQPEPPPHGAAPAPRRVYMDSELRERLVGGIVLPPELNQPAQESWEIRAEISISEEGDVRHIFLERPLESPEMNGYVIRLLHGLRFSSSREPAEGRVEIYSAAAVVEEEAPP
jgi:hypothetical protein